LLNWVVLPGPIAPVTAAIALALVIYLLRRAFHAIPLPRRIHRMHHTDLDFEVTTGLRFHPIETVIGASATAVLVLRYC
jgi:sterol desaturase/sphingolipid hydroxylase (fatty acid hydroxylase superfamily)